MLWSSNAAKESTGIATAREDMFGFGNRGVLADRFVFIVIATVLILMLDFLAIRGFNEHSN